MAWGGHHPWLHGIHAMRPPKYQAPCHHRQEAISPAAYARISISAHPPVADTRARRSGPTCQWASQPRGPHLLPKTTHSAARLLLPPTTLRMKKSFSRLSSPLAPSFSLLTSASASISVYPSPPLIRRRSPGVERALSRYSSQLPPATPALPAHFFV
jgi:hypothetical protein